MSIIVHFDPRAALGSDNNTFFSEVRPASAAGIRRVKGAKRLGVRIGNWLTIEQAKGLLQEQPCEGLRAKRDRAILAILIGCGLRRAELVGLKAQDFQIREEHWVIADLIGKGKHIRTVPVPVWVKRALDCWTAAAEITGGTIFRRVNRMGKLLGLGDHAEGNLACGESSRDARWN
jgi:site-specific recombinase XerC